MDYANAVVVGRVTKDPEVVAVGETSVASFTLATNNNYKKKDGEKISETAYIEVKAWGGLSKVTEYLSKGSECLVSGRISQENWEDKDSGKKRSKLVVIANGISLGSKPKQDTADEKKSEPEDKPAESGDNSGDDDSSDVPF